MKNEAWRNAWIVYRFYGWKKFEKLKGVVKLYRNEIPRFFKFKFQMKLRKTRQGSCTKFQWNPFNFNFWFGYHIIVLSLTFSNLFCQFFCEKCSQLTAWKTSKFKFTYLYEFRLKINANKFWLNTIFRRNFRIGNFCESRFFQWFF